MTVRQRFVVLHRYVGLVMAGFLIIAGLTGALLVWYYELDALINPQWLQVEPPAAHSEPLSPFGLRDQVDAAYPDANVHWMMLAPPDAHSPVRFFLSPKPGAPALPIDEVFVNPYTGQILGGRLWGDLGQGLANLMPFVYRLHHSLALGTLGTWIFGIIALLWTLDCFVGAWLTFPPPRRRDARHRPRRFWTRWAKAWQIRWRAGGHKRTFDLHRAGGLWPWALLLVFAWSGVALTLYDQVYRPTTGLFLSFQENPLDTVPARANPSPQPPIGWEPGYHAARQHLETLAEERDLTIHALERFAYTPRKNALKLMARTSSDVNERFGETWVYVDATDGAVLGHYLPTGEAAGNTVTTWLTSLHIAAVGGVGYRVLATVLGVAVIVLSVTGILIWWRKRAKPARSQRLELWPWI
ncbi:MAG: hypothetical protein CL545_06560 [Alcanivorax sp.]|nr:hypothetical protein [Alcanivorax sp.]